MNQLAETQILPSFYLVVQGTISIGGAHIKAGTSLPNDLQQFLDESKDGLIYFSLGTVLNTSMLPSEVIKAFFGMIAFCFFVVVVFMHVTNHLNFIRCI